MKSQLYIWHYGQTYGCTIAEGVYKRPEGYVIYYPNFVATSDCQTWASVCPGTKGEGLIPPDTTVYVVSKNRWGRLEPEHRLLMEWGREATKNKLIGEIVRIPAAQLLDVVAFESPVGTVSYVGFREAMGKKSPHTLPHIHELVVACIEECAGAWGWKPHNLEVKFHDTSKAMGLAFEPGKKVHKISLHKYLISHYDTHGIGRVIKHELCHHYRDETFPRSQDPHDRRFCEELGKVDGKVLGHVEQCSTFIEVQDATIVAAKHAKKPGSEAVWSPTAGVLHLKRLKSGHFRVTWLPNPGQTFSKWSEPLSDAAFLIILRNFSPGQWPDIRVTAESWYWHGQPAPTTLADLATLFFRTASKFFPKTGEYILSLTKASPNA